MSAPRLLISGDEAALERFLVAHADSSMFLRSNVRRAGIVFRGEAYQADYVAAWADGAITGVAAHGWNGLILLQAPDAAGALACAAAATSRREVKGLIGPWAQLVAARDALGLTGAPTTMCSREDLFTLHLVPRDGGDLRAPPASARVRLTREDDLPLLIEWRVAYLIEAMGGTPGPALADEAAAGIRRNHEGKAGFVLEDDRGELVSCSAFNAELPDTVQVGGVYTPPHLRRRGYARAVVGGSLLIARERGVERSILFTGDDAANVAARTAYLGLGYRIVGDYGILLLAAPLPAADSR